MSKTRFSSDVSLTPKAYLNVNENRGNFHFLTFFLMIKLCTNFINPKGNGRKQICKKTGESDSQIESCVLIRVLRNPHRKVIPCFYGFFSPNFKDTPVRYRYTKITYGPRSARVSTKIKTPSFLGAPFCYYVDLEFTVGPPKIDRHPGVFRTLASQPTS